MDKKEKFLKLWKEAGGEEAAKGTLKEISKKLKVPEGTIRRWKSEHIKKNNANVRGTNRKKEQTDERSEKKKDNEPKSIVEEIIDPELENIEVAKSYKVFTEKEKMFITYYFLYKFSIKAASLAAGYSSEREGNRVIKKTKIQQAISRIKNRIVEKAGLNFTKEDLIEELFVNLKKATGEIPQVKTFIMEKFDKVTTPITVRTFEGKLKDGTTVEGTEIYGELEKGSFKDVVKNKINEISYQEPEEHVVRDTDLKAANMTAKLIADLYGFTDNSMLAREKFEHEKQSANANQENNVKKLLETIKDGVKEDES